MKVEIKDVFGKVIYSSEAISLRECVENAVKDYANLRGANLTGAYIREKVKINKQPIQVDAIQYYVFIYDNHMKIGCEFHSIKDWFSYDDSRIIEMDGKNALKFWRKWKDLLQDICYAEYRK